MTIEQQIPVEQKLIEMMKSLNALQQQCIEALETLPKRVLAADKEMEKKLFEGIEVAARQSAEVKKDKHSIRQNARKLYGIHIKPILTEARQDFKGDILDKACVGLYITGKLWNSVSLFWHALADKHTPLKIFNNIIVKPMAILLYSRILPEIAIIKSAEFVGRSIKAFRKAEKGQKFRSIVNVAKQMGKEIAMHCDRLAFGSPIQKVVSALSSTIGIKEETIDSVVKAITTNKEFDQLDKNTAVAVALSVASNVKDQKNLKEVLERAVDAATHPENYPKITIQNFLDNLPKEFPKPLIDKLGTLVGKVDVSLPIEEAIKLVKKAKTFKTYEKDDTIKSLIEFSVSKNLWANKDLPKTHVSTLMQERRISPAERAKTI